MAFAVAEATFVSDQQGKKGYELMADVPQSERDLRAERAKWSESDRVFMRRALELARQAGCSEVPVGAVVVSSGVIIGEGSNRPIASHDPTAHAEIAAIRQASARERNYRLPCTTLYVTLEPCSMCAGAIVLARIERLVFAARDLRFGAVRSKFRLADSDLLNHRARVEEGLFAAEAGEIINQFFESRRDSRPLG